MSSTVSGAGADAGAAANSAMNSTSAGIDLPAGHLRGWGDRAHHVSDGHESSHDGG
jgi:hypothetical protein